MKTHTTIALAGAVLLAGATTASAALFSSTPKPSDSLSLSSWQQQTAWNDLSSAATLKAPADFNATTSSAVPSTLKVHAIPNKTASDVPALRAYDFAKVQGKLLIVNPHDMMIARVITG